MNPFIMPATLQFNIEVHARPLVDVEMYCMVVTTFITNTEMEICISVYKFYFHFKCNCLACTYDELSFFIVIKKYSR